MPLGRFWQRLLVRLRTTLHETSSPHQIALGFTLGLSFSMLPVPLVGLALGLGSAAFVRGNLVAAYVGSAVMNPLTGPFIFFAELWAGLTLSGLPVPRWEVVREFTALQWFSMLQELVAPFGLGIAVMSLAAIVVGYPLAYVMASAAKRRHVAT